MQVVIGEQFVVPAYSKVSLLRQPINQDSDEELEYADDSSGVAEHSRKSLWIWSFLMHIIDYSVSKRYASASDSSGSEVYDCLF